MPLKTHQLEDPGINLTPMIDCMFLLVIFFMFGTQFTAAERQYDINLPTVSVAQPLTSLPDEIVVNVTRDGTVLVKDKPVSLEELRQTLGAAQQRFADQSVVIRGDGAVDYQRVMDVMNLCQQAKITHVQLAIRLREGITP
jgi:biopolymer transport protein ExbD